MFSLPVTSRLLRRVPVVGPDWLAHIPRETDGEHHLTVCGKYVRGAPGTDRPHRGRCPVCYARATDQGPICGRGPEVPEAVKLGRGVRFGPARGGRLADRQGNH